MLPTTNSFLHAIAICECEGPRPDFVGSGVLLRIEGKDYIATAAHVVEDLEKIGIAMVRGNEVIGTRDRPSKIFAAKQENGSYSAGIDLALLATTDRYRDFVEEQGLSFFDLDKNGPPPTTGECFISGFPGKKNYYDPRRNSYAKTCGCYHIQSFMKDAERVIAIGGDPEFHFSLEISKRSDFSDGSTGKQIPELFDLHGMSGSGVWHMPAGQGALIPECATGIAGILIEDRDTKNDRQGMAKVVKIEAIHNLLKFAKSQPETFFFVE